MPDDPLLYADEVAALIGIRADTWRAYVNRDQAPEPEDRVPEGAHVRPRWRRSVIEAWMAQRPGRGVRRKEADR